MKLVNFKSFHIDRIPRERYLKIFWKSMWSIQNDPADPCYFIDSDDTCYRTGLESYSSDLGSTPRILELIFPHDEFIVSYGHHDYGWKQGGLYVKKPNEIFYDFVKIPRFKLNCLLRSFVQAEGEIIGGGGKFKRNVIKLGTDIGALWPF